MKKIYTVLTLSIALIVASCGDTNQTTVPDNAPAIAVTVKRITPQNNTSFLAVSGKIQSVNTTDLSTRMMGYVNKVYVNVGDKVSKGQLLIAINNTDLQAKSAQVNASITEATVAYNTAEKDYSRFKNLYADQSASQKELDDMTANFEMAKARLEVANQMKKEVNSQFIYSNITAPFSGVVTSKTITEGDMANPGQPLITVESPGNYEVIAMVPETEISQIKKETQVTVAVKAIDKIITGQVTAVSASSKHTGGQYLVKVALDKSEANLLSGMFTTVQFPVAKQTKNEMILIPRNILVTKGQMTGVYTVSQYNTAMLRWLRLGRTYGDQVEVLSGLSTNEDYIISAEGRLYNGVKIAIQ